MRYKNKKKKNYTFYKYLIIYTLIFTSIISINKIGVDNIIFINKLKDGTLYLYNKITSPIESLKTLKSVLILSKENEELKKELNNLSGVEKENEELEKNISKLNKMLELNNTYKDEKLINAEVVLRNKDYWYNTLTINKGSKSNIKNGDVVISAFNLIGKVISTSDNTSVVLLITSNKNKISVNINNNDKSYFADITDYKDGLFTLEGITNYDKVGLGDIVKTSSYSSYKENLVIGVVDKIDSNNYETGKIIKVKPDIDFDDIKYVSIMRGI